MDDFDAFVAEMSLGHRRPDLRLVPHQVKLGNSVAGVERGFDAFDDNLATMVATHDIHYDSHKAKERRRNRLRVRAPEPTVKPKPRPSQPGGPCSNHRPGRHDAEQRDRRTADRCSIEAVSARYYRPGACADDSATVFAWGYP